MINVRSKTDVAQNIASEKETPRTSVQVISKHIVISPAAETDMQFPGGPVMISRIRHVRLIECKHIGFLSFEKSDTGQ